jgi:NAD(P)-dependent dehydrogenase (short-subunit alcohol dehydrogenase family)
MAFAREGASVVIAARGVERGEAVAREINEAGGNAIFVPTDVSKSSDVETLVKRAVDSFGRIDCALNNAAAHSGMHAHVNDFSEEEFDCTVAVSLKGIWLAMKYELNQMLAQDPTEGVIVNVSSVSGLGGTATGAVYAAVKAGVIALTKSAALEYAGNNIRINTLVPGAFLTPMLEWGFERAARGDEEARKMIREHIASTIPLGRIGDPFEAAEAAVWLCSDASSYVTGHSMIIDGGFSVAAR